MKLFETGDHGVFTRVIVVVHGRKEPSSSSCGCAHLVGSFDADRDVVRIDVASQVMFRSAFLDIGEVVGVGDEVAGSQGENVNAGCIL